MRKIFALIVKTLCDYRVVDSWLFLWTKWSQLQWWNMLKLKHRPGSKNYRGTLTWIILLLAGHMAQEAGRSTSAVCQAKNTCHFPGKLPVFHSFSWMF